MVELTPVRWHADRQSLTQALAGARSVQTLADPHVSALLPSRVVQRQAPQLFSEVRVHCTSFSAWWNRTTRGASTLNDLPGLAAWTARQALAQEGDGTTRSTRPLGLSVSR